MAFKHLPQVATALALALNVSLATPALAAEYVVAQKGKAFSTTKLKVKLGDTVKFVNEDAFSHNVFSLSATKGFDLGSYPQGGPRV